MGDINGVYKTRKTNGKEEWERRNVMRWDGKRWDAI